MEIHPILLHRENPLPQPISPIPTSPSSSSSSSNGTTATRPTPPTTPIPSPPPLTPKSMDSNPNPTTFIQADASSFKQVVQMLTGSAQTTARHAAPPQPPKKAATGPKKPPFKLYERRSSLKNLKMISPLVPTFANSNANSPLKPPEILSPSVLDFPSLVLSPVTPLIPDPFNRSPQPNPAMSAEDRAIAEKGFYLHPSPRSTPRDAEPPRLLPLFPLTSPRDRSSPSDA
ncbi:VQ motif-containing protein 4-like [Typha angustifolia]|uniref:VQ motif-containing protein 4-like n=1 Tax=Typha angustifolia TaxID=59011 RepID=UPI003C2ED0CD